MNFEAALKALKKRKSVLRSGWNGKGMWLTLVPASKDLTPSYGSPYYKAGLKDPICVDAHIDMYTAQGTMQPGWLASQSDLLAEDWEIK